MSMNFTRQLVHLVTKVQFSDFSAATIDKAKIHLLDTLGAALAGAHADEVEKTLGLIHSSGESPLWGCKRRVAPRDAALINGIAAHAYELDDCGGCDHSGAVVVPAMLALLPLASQPVSGKNLLIAQLMGYEGARRILEACGGYETHNELGWHSTGTCGVFGAAIAAGLVLGLEEEKLIWALGIAGSCAGGTWNFIHDGSGTKKLHAGRAAEGGVMAVLMAQAGFQGPTHILEPHCWGSYFSSFGQDKGRAEILIENFGENWRLNRCSLKPYATCRGTHSAIDALILICNNHNIKKADIAKIEVRLSHFQAGMCGGKIVSSRAQAQMSLAYALAAQLTYGEVFLNQLDESAYNNNVIQDWIARTDIIIDEAMLASAEPEITLVLQEGQSFCATVPYPLGSPQNPLSQSQTIAKFENLSQSVLTKAQIDRLIDMVLTLETIERINELPQLLTKS